MSEIVSIIRTRDGYTYRYPFAPAKLIAIWVAGGFALGAAFIWVLK